ncbi:hypothetical protein NTGM5_20022 [Candidatus Nitrotoga sp. M5]|nr:hypothetical protein NTGM5_20022 [Candidatus Nitrotoga sp. M5]
MMEQYGFEVLMCYIVPNQTHMMPFWQKKLKFVWQLVELKESSRKLSGTKDNFASFYLAEKCRLTPFEV